MFFCAASDDDTCGIAGGQQCVPHCQLFRPIGM
jgi:hypothetical protein